MATSKAKFVGLVLSILIISWYCGVTNIVKDLNIRQLLDPDLLAKDRFQNQGNIRIFSVSDQDEPKLEHRHAVAAQEQLHDDRETLRSVVDAGDKLPWLGKPKRLPMLKIFDFNYRPNVPHNLTYFFDDCPYNACQFTVDPKEADLVMINGARLKMEPLPPRYKNQIWMLYTKEPPTFKRFSKLQRNDLKNQINWTKCIFKDSTFRGQYGAVKERAMPLKDYDAIYSQKKFQVAWFVSHCQTQSRREEYVARLSKVIDVHIFGKCGHMSCGKYGFEMGGQKDVCTNMLTKDYKFYLSFENSMCNDYVTEKFYNILEDVDVIPVVRSGFDYEEFVDPGAIVNAKDFSSPEELGRYLLKLSEDKNMYIDMLKKKNSYIRTDPWPYFPCQLCEAMHTKRHEPSVYGDIFEWLAGHCWEPNDL